MTNELTSYLRRLSVRRSNGRVTADDAQNFLTRKGVRRNRRVSMINKVFQYPSFVVLGQRASQRPVSRYRKINEWIAV